MVPNGLDGAWSSTEGAWAFCFLALGQADAVARPVRLPLQRRREGYLRHKAALAGGLPTTQPAPSLSPPSSPRIGTSGSAGQPTAAGAAVLPQAQASLKSLPSFKSQPSLPAAPNPPTAGPTIASRWQNRLLGCYQVGERRGEKLHAARHIVEPALPLDARFCAHTLAAIQALTLCLIHALDSTGNSLHILCAAPAALPQGAASRPLSVAVSASSSLRNMRQDDAYAEVRLYIKLSSCCVWGAAGGWEGEGGSSVGGWGGGWGALRSPSVGAAAFNALHRLHG